MNEFKQKEKIKLLTVAVICLIGIIGVVSYTYSFFQIEAENSTVIKGEAASAELDVTVTKVASTEETELGLIPQLSEYITTAVVGRNNKSCIDDNGNEVCQVYQIHVTNVSASSVKVDGTVELTAGSNSNLRWARISHAVTTQNQTKPTLLSEVNNHDYQELVTNETFTGGQQKDYYIVVWIEETGTPQLDRGEFSGKVVFKTHEELVPAMTTLTSLNLTSSLKTDTPDFTKTSCSEGCDESTVGLYEYEDDLGISYYFRGDVENNYVKFAKNASNQDMYWRIIRINGDGTVRMIYDGTQAWENGVYNPNRKLLDNYFHNEFDGDDGAEDNAYVGYMFGQTGVTATGTDGYNATHSNDRNSTIKTYLEGEPTSNNTGWYYENIIATGYHQYVADAIYCNDRSLGASGTGIGTSETYYDAYERLYRNYTTDVDPQLICTNKNDRFTISTSTLAPIDGLGTNQKLKYPVGLITADEVVLAGGNRLVINQKFYLYSEFSYWTMTPAFFDGYAAEFEMFTDIDDKYTDGISGVRPVISLRSDALKFGNGTIGNEFRLEA